MLFKDTFFRLFFIGSVIAGLLLCSCNSRQEDKLTIAVAANLQFVIDDLVQAYSDNTGVACEVIVGSSGKLTAQIIEGAPFDVFLSADMKYPNELFEKGYTLKEPEIYAYGNLILWTLKSDLKPELTSLEASEVRHIAIGNPKTAPYGASAMQVLHEAGLENILEEKLVYGESVSQTNQFIISKAADIGFTSKSVVMSTRMKDKGSWKEIDKNLYSPMAQGMVVLNSRKAFKEKSMQFSAFIFSDEGKKILHKFGYQIALQ